MKIIAIGAIIIGCGALIYEFGEFVDDVIPYSHRREAEAEEERKDDED